MRRNQSTHHVHAAFNRPLRTGALVFGVLATACATAHADDCAIVRKAALATLQSPTGMRQYLKIGDRPERLVSITKGDTVYLALAPGMWKTLPRSELRAEAARADAEKPISQCHAEGEEIVDGQPTTFYDYLSQVAGTKTAQTRVWIGRDGLIYRQSVTGHGGTMRYEFKNVTAPS